MTDIPALVREYSLLLEKRLPERPENPNVVLVSELYPPYKRGARASIHAVPVRSKNGPRLATPRRSVLFEGLDESVPAHVKKQFPLEKVL
jgi:hypothetical protein